MKNNSEIIGRLYKGESDQITNVFSEKYSGLSRIVDLGKLASYINSVFDGAKYSSRNLVNILDEYELKQFNKVKSSDSLDELYSKGFDLSNEEDLLRFNFYSLILEIDNLSTERQIEVLHQIKKLLPSEVLNDRDRRANDFEDYKVNGIAFTFFKSAFDKYFKKLMNGRFFYTFNREGTVIYLFTGSYYTFTSSSPLSLSDSFSPEQNAFILKDVPANAPLLEDERFKRFSHSEFLTLLDGKKIKLYKKSDDGYYIELIK